MPVNEGVKETWKANEQVNEILLEQLTPDMSEAKTSEGGYSVTQQLAHITEVKKFWGMVLDKKQPSTLPNLYNEARKNGRQNG
jgi:uncharacterized damage-inducible protein DinB